MLNPNNPSVLSSLVRPVISLIFTAAIWVGFFMGKLSGETLLGIYGTIIGFWFGERSALKTPEQNLFTNSWRKAKTQGSPPFDG